MTMTGHQFEHFVAEVFRGNGWKAQVTPGSGDYGVDVVLTGPNPVGRTVRVAVQVKMHASAVGPKAVQEVHTGKAMHRCDEAWVVTGSTFTPAAVRLAAVNGVRLIAGPELAKLAESSGHQARQDGGARWRSRWPLIKAVLVVLYVVAMCGAFIELFSGTMDGNSAITFALMAIGGIVWVAVRYGRRLQSLSGQTKRPLSSSAPPTPPPATGTSPTAGSPDTPRQNLRVQPRYLQRRNRGDGSLNPPPH